MGRRRERRVFDGVVVLVGEGGVGLEVGYVVVERVMEGREDLGDWGDGTYVVRIWGGAADLKARRASSKSVARSTVERGWLARISGFWRSGWMGNLRENDTC